MLRNLVWDRLHGQSRPAPPRDVDLAFFDVLDSELLSFRSDCDTGDKRLGPGCAWLGSLGTWSILLCAAFHGGWILRDRIKLEIECTLRTAKRLDHLLACYRISQSGHRGQKKKGEGNGNQPAQPDRAFGGFIEQLYKG